MKRTVVLCSINGQQHNPGDKVLDTSSRKTQSFLYNAGGSINYHS